MNRILLPLCVKFLTLARYSGDAEAFANELINGFLSTSSIVSSAGDAAKEKLQEMLLAILTKKEGKIRVSDDCLGALNVILNIAQSADTNYEDLYESDWFEIYDGSYSVVISHEDMDEDGSGCSSLTIQPKKTV